MEKKGSWLLLTVVILFICLLYYLVLYNFYVASPLDSLIGGLGDFHMVLLGYWVYSFTAALDLGSIVVNLMIGFFDGYLIEG